jgi:hypothetical protein
MTDICLSFPDKATADSVLYTTVDQVTDVDGNVVVEASVTPNYKNIDIIPTVYEPNVDPELPPVALPGYAVNVYTLEGEDEAVLAPYVVVPSPRYRVWA